MGDTLMADTGVVTTNELLEDPIRDEDQKREIIRQKIKNIKKIKEIKNLQKK